MNALSAVLDVVLMAVATVVAMLLIGTLSRRLLGVRVGVIRIVIAGLIGLGAEVGFESQYGCWPIGGTARYFESS